MTSKYIISKIKFKPIFSFLGRKFKPAIMMIIYGEINYINY